MTNRKGIKLTPEYIKSHIAEVIYEDRVIGGHRVMHCHFRMDNGFIVYGQTPSTSIDPENFDEELGKELSYENTFSQLWQLEAYRALSEKKLIEGKQSLDIDIRYYEVTNNISELSPGPDCLRGRQYEVLFRSPHDKGPGIVGVFKDTDDPYAKGLFEAQAEAERKKIADYIRSHMKPEELHTDLVLRIAKTGHEAVRAYNQHHVLGDGVRQEDLPWDQTSDEHKRRVCEAAERILLSKEIPEDEQPFTVTGATQAVFRGIVLSFL